MSAPNGSVAKFDFWGKIQKSCVKNSMNYRLPNSRKSNFATEPRSEHDMDSTTPSLTPALLPCDREGLERPKENARLIFQLLRLQIQGGEALHQGLERLLSLYPRQGRPQTVMDARPKGDMQIRVSGNVELLRRSKLLRVTVGRGEEPPYTVQRLDALPPQFDLLYGDTLQRLDRRIIAQALLRSAHRQCKVTLQ